MDLSVLQDFRVTVADDWCNWQFQQEEYQSIPLSNFNRVGKVNKCCDLSAVQNTKDDEQFSMVQGNMKISNKEQILKNVRMSDKRKATFASTRIFTKKQKKNYKTWHNRYKTKFRQAIKNDWTLIKAINKRQIDQFPAPKRVHIQVLKEKGQLYTLNKKVQKISWNPVGFKENQVYKVKPILTLQNNYLKELVHKLVNSEQKIRKSLICAPEFLLAIMTVRGGQYPWSITIEKDEDVILMQNYKAVDQSSELSYVDLFTPNENTSENMPSDQTKIKETCITATRLTKAFKYLLASGDPAPKSQEQKIQEKQQQEQQQEEQEQEQEEITGIRKIVKIVLDDLDIYTYVNVDGAKENQDGTIEPCLIRTFVETGTDGGWLEQLKVQQGKLVFQEYLANSCSLQKWICQAYIAGVSLIKTGFIGFSKQKPQIVNVSEATVKSLQKFISFKYEDCWGVIKYLANLVHSCENGTYILTRSAYTPISLKLSKVPNKQEQQEEDDI